ncbi:hypothetical protein RDI58_024298 [Solanum bulbocastanum]|uniref:Uncharacterized protein n=1 Tax=Solanum bulbocastanum TaxID=147425 RepID=A0AAN8Y2U1_SOLBU
MGRWSNAHLQCY